MTKREIIYYLYGNLKTAINKLLRRTKKSPYNFFYTYNLSDIGALGRDLTNVNGMVASEIKSEDLFYGENITTDTLSSYQPMTISSKNIKGQNIQQKWMNCIKGAKIPSGWKNTGYYHTAYIKEEEKWCLSSWLWTSAAIGRVLCLLNDPDGIDIADRFVEDQLLEGGWVVRYDIIDGELIRLAAPNDSAYIANNSLLSAYRLTKNEKYLSAATKCADWVMTSSQPNGLVPFGYNVDSMEWITDHNIVDIGFTAGLFCELYKITKEEKYKKFAIDFSESYIKSFYDKNIGLFSTYINSRGEKRGGYFSRGQAWALEGLIPVYEICNDNKIFDLIEKQALIICNHQLRNGGWPCNFQGLRQLMGEDCKGISCIAKSLLNWSRLSNNRETLEKAVEAACHWCEIHTDEKTGMILSYSTDGAIEHSQNTSTGMLYANAYAIETMLALMDIRPI